jgi:hypothetical protein
VSPAGQSLHPQVLPGMALQGSPALEWLPQEMGVMCQQHQRPLQELTLRGRLLSWVLQLRKALQQL